MRILFDQATPVGLRRFLEGHEVKTAHQMGWSQLTNGELLSAAEAEQFDLLITADKNLSYQQNLSTRVIAVLVLFSGQWPEVRKHAERIALAVNAMKAGSFLVIDPH